MDATAVGYGASGERAALVPSFVVERTNHVQSVPNYDRTRRLFYITKHPI